MATDRLSELPDSLIHEILSRLPMREVVATMLFSKRWKDLWTTVPCLQFHSESEGDDLLKFRRFFSEVLKLWKGKKIVSLSFRYHMECEDPDLDSSLEIAVKKQVEELCVDSTGGPYECPDCVYDCSSLKKLTLNVVTYYIVKDLRWNQLKSLTLQRPEPYSFGVMDDLFKGAPLLEFLNLRLLEYHEDFAIRSKSLKMLKIEYFDPDPDYTEGDLTVDAPNLESLEISGIWHTICSMNVPSLKTVVLGFDNRYNLLLMEDLPCGAAVEAFRQVFQSISHVENLTLNEWSFMLLVDKMEGEFFVEFPNVKSLKLYAREAGGIPRAFNMFPVLEVLAIEHKESAYYLVAPKTVIPDLSLLQLKTIEITWDVRDASMIKVIRVLLQNARVLEKLKLRFRNQEASPRRFLSTKNRVMKMPRSSTHATLIVNEELI